MKKLSWRDQLLRVVVPGGCLLALSGCPLSDQQITSVFQTVLTSTLTSIANAFISGLANGTDMTGG